MQPLFPQPNLKKSILWSIFFQLIRKFYCMWFYFVRFIWVDNFYKVLFFLGQCLPFSMLPLRCGSSVISSSITNFNMCTFRGCQFHFVLFLSNLFSSKPQAKYSRGQNSRVRVSSFFFNNLIIMAAAFQWIPCCKSA